MKKNQSIKLNAVVRAALVSIGALAAVSPALALTTFDAGREVSTHMWTDYSDASGRMNFTRFRNMAISLGSETMGEKWRHNFDITLKSYSSILKIERVDGALRRFTVAGLVQNPDGSYSATAGTYTAGGDIKDRLVVKTDGAGKISSVIFRNASEMREEVFGPDFRLNKIVYFDGYTQTLARNAAGTIESVTDSNGRTLVFNYDAKGLLAGFQDPAGQPYVLGRDSTDLFTSITYPDGSSVQSFANNTIDELGNYIESGGTAGATNLGVSEQIADTYWIDYPTKSKKSVTHTLAGLSTTRTYHTINGRFRLVAQDQPAGEGCGAATKSRAFDAFGNVIREDNFSNMRTCWAYDTSRQLTVTTVEGLAIGTDCGTVLPAGSAIPLEARKTSVEYHPVWDAPTRIATARSVRTIVFHGQPDPTNGNQILNCVAGLPVLPSGSPVALPCKIVDKATTDADGGQGFNAAADTAVAARVTTFSYDADGHLISSTPFDGGTYTITRYAQGEGGNTKGDIKTMTDAKGFVTTFNSYNPHGQLLMKTDPTGLVVENTYDLRGRMLTSSVDGIVTTYTVDPRGLVTKVTSQDGSEVNFTYDPITRRVTQVTDKKGNSVNTQFHPNGIPSVRTWQGPLGQTVRRLEQGIDALGRVRSIKG